MQLRVLESEFNRLLFDTVSTSQQQTIAIGSDHAGFELKQHLIGVLELPGHVVTDFGTNST
jgi:hypothetical protein